MLLHFTANPRKYRPENIIGIASNFLDGVPWMETRSIVVREGVTGPANAATVLAEILPPEKKYKLGKLEQTGEQIVARVAAFEAANPGEYEHVADGRHSGIAQVIACAYGMPVNPRVAAVDMSEDEADTYAYRANAVNELTAQLERVEAARHLEQLIARGEVTCQSDVAALGHKRGKTQLMWAIHRASEATGVPMAELAALKGNYKVFADIADAKTEEEALVKLEEAKTAAADGNEKKVLSGEVLRWIAAYVAENATLEDASEEQVAAYGLLAAIVHANEPAAKTAARMLVGKRRSGDAVKVQNMAEMLWPTE